MLAESTAAAVRIAERAYRPWLKHLELLWVQNGAKLPLGLPPEIGPMLAARAAFAGTVNDFKNFLAEQIHSTGANYFVCDLAFGDLTEQEFDANRQATGGRSYARIRGVAWSGLVPKNSQIIAQPICASWKDRVMAEPIKFPNVPVYTGFNQTVRAETDVRDLEVIEGAIPESFAGTLYRVGPDPRYPARLGDDEWTNGDGLVVMFRFENGHVDLKTRYVRTERFLLEEKARKSLFGRYRNTYTNDPSVSGAKNGTANTNVVWHGGKLLALKEDSVPIELDPDTLATKGDWDYDGRMTARTMTAHPKLDYATGELLSFSFQARGDCTTDFAYWVIDKHGKITHQTWFNAPYPGWVHDFAMSTEHVVFPMTPMITELEVLRQGGPFYRYHPDKDYHFAVLPRYGAVEDVRWFRGPSGSCGHVANAFTEGIKVSPRSLPSGGRSCPSLRSKSRRDVCRPSAAVFDSAHLRHEGK